MRTVLIVGDVPTSVGHDVACRFLQAGYRVRAPRRFCHSVEEGVVLGRAEADFLVGSSLVSENENYVEADFDLQDRDRFRECMEGCSAVLLLTRHIISGSVTDDRAALKHMLAAARDASVPHIIYGAVPVCVEHGDSASPLAESPEASPANQTLEGEVDRLIGASRQVVSTLLPDVSTKGGTGLVVHMEIATYNKDQVRRTHGKLPEARTIRQVAVGPDGTEHPGTTARVYEEQVGHLKELLLYLADHTPMERSESWIFLVAHRWVLSHFRLGRHIADFVRNPRIPFRKRIQFVGRSIRRSIDAAMMMLLLHVWPEQVYRFSTRRLLPARSERYEADHRDTVPFALIPERTHQIERARQINVVMRGPSLDMAELERMEGPVYLVNFSSPVRTKQDVIYLEQNLGQAYQLQRMGLPVCHVEVNRIAEDGQTFPPKGYSDSELYKRLLVQPNFTRIAIAERIGRPFKLPLTDSWRPAGAGVNSICALSYFADKVNVYGWDFYLDRSPEEMSYWQLFFNLNKFKLDVFRSRLHFECAIINLYYGYHLSRLPQFDNHGYMGRLDGHERLISRIERVLFNSVPYGQAGPADPEAMVRIRRDGQ